MAAAAPSSGDTLLARWSGLWRAGPERPALVAGADPGNRLNGGALDDLTARAAGHFAAVGVAPGERVLWSCAATIDSVVALLGALRMGAVVVPVSPSCTASELAYVIADAAPAMAVVERDEQRAWVAATGRALPVLSPSDVGSAVAARDTPDLDAARPGGDALIVYTSGTTGQPKGAVHTHASLLAGADALRVAWGWQPDDRLILALPLFHVHGLCAGLFGTLTAGASALVFERFAAPEVCDAVSEASMFFGVPTMFHRLAASGRAAELSRLRLCVSGSAPLPADLWRQFEAEGIAVLERYGMSETLLTLSNPLIGERRPGSVGTPLPGIEAAIDAPDALGVGELLVRGASLYRGYWGRSEAAASIGEDGWFATGDLASVAPDGYVSIRGRRTELIISGGHNVYPAEVEAVLGRHPSVAEIAVVGVPSPEWGESVVAFVVGASGPPDLPALQALAQEELAPFKRPRQFHVMDALPRNAMGKVVRREL